MTDGAFGEPATVPRARELRDVHRGSLGSDRFGLTSGEMRRLRSMLEVVDPRAEQLPTLRTVGELAGVSTRLLRRRFRTTERLVEHVVDAAFEGARPLVTHGRRSSEALLAVVETLVAQRVAVHDAIADVIPFVSARRAGDESIHVLNWALRSELEFQLGRLLPDVSDAERGSILDACDDALSVMWIGVLRSTQRRTRAEVESLLAGHVMNLLASHGVAVRRRRGHLAVVEQGRGTLPASEPVVEDAAAVEIASAR